MLMITGEIHCINFKKFGLVVKEEDNSTTTILF
jgi:hypothetical protein